MDNLVSPLNLPQHSIKLIFFYQKSCHHEIGTSVVFSPFLQSLSKRKNKKTYRSTCWAKNVNPVAKWRVRPLEDPSCKAPKSNLEIPQGLQERHHTIIAGDGGIGCWYLATPRSGAANTPKDRTSLPSNHQFSAPNLLDSFQGGYPHLVFWFTQLCLHRFGFLVILIGKPFWLGRQFWHQHLPPIFCILSTWISWKNARLVEASFYLSFVFHALCWAFIFRTCWNTLYQHRPQITWKGISD